MCACVFVCVCVFVYVYVYVYVYANVYVCVCVCLCVCVRIHTQVGLLVNLAHSGLCTAEHIKSDAVVQSLMVLGAEQVYLCVHIVYVYMYAVVQSLMELGAEQMPVGNTLATH